MRTSDCDGATCTCSCPRSTVTLRSSLPAASNIVRPTAFASGPSPGGSDRATAVSSSVRRWGPSAETASGVMAGPPSRLARGALALVAERGLGGGVGGLGHLAQAPAAVDRLADAVGEVDQQREAALLQQHAVGQRD